MKKKSNGRGTSNKKPPQSPETEIALLGSIFFEPAVMTEIVDIVAPEDFYEPANMAVAQVIWDLWGKTDKPLDAALIYNELCKREQEKLVGGYEGLMQLADAVPEASHAAHYAKIVKEKSQLRRLISMCQAGIGDAYAAGADADMVVDKAHDRMFGLVVGKKRTDVVDAHDEGEAELAALDAPEGERHAVWTGFNDIDAVTGGLHDGEITMLAGRPSMGKTTLALNITEHLALRQGKRAIFFSLEVPKRQVVRNLMAMGARVPVTKLRNRTVTPEERKALDDALGRLEKRMIWVTGQPKTALEMKAIIRQLQTRHEISLIVVDYIQLFLKTIDRRVAEMSLISRQLKCMAQELDLPFLVLSQLSRKCEDRKNKMPVLADLRESGALEQDADAVFLLWRRDQYITEEEEPDNMAVVHIAKQRHGATKWVKLYFRKEVLRFEDLAREEEPPPKKEKPKSKKAEGVMFGKPEEKERLPYKDAPEKEESQFGKDENGSPVWNPDNKDCPF